MPFIENTFNLTLNSVTLGTHTITGLTSADSTTSITNVSPEASLMFAKAVQKTLLDAGYNATLNTSTYMITVLGFSFFCISKSATATVSKYDAYYQIYTYGSADAVSGGTGSSYYLMNDGAGGLSAKFVLRLRGDADGFVLTFGAYKYPTADAQMIFITRGTNLVDNSYAWMYGANIEDNNKVRLTDKYATLDTINRYHTSIMNSEAGFNTTTHMAYTPVTAYHNTIYLPSLISANDTYIKKGSTYKIGNEIFWAAAYRRSSYATASWSGEYSLIRIS